MTPNGKVTAFKKQFRRRTHWFFSVLFLSSLVIAMPLASAEESVEEKYLQIYRLVTQADSSSAAGKADAAKAQYRDAQVALLKFKKENPTWNPALISYRLEYLSEKISPRPPLAAPTPTTAPTPKSAEQTFSKPTQKAASTSASASKSPARLLNAGNDPRKVLRLHPRAGDKQTMQMTMKIAMDMGMGEPMKMPAMKMTMNVTIKNVLPNGDINYEAVFGETEILDEPGVPPQVAQAMKGSASSMKGVLMTGTMSEYGVNKNVQVKAPAGAAPQMRQALEQMKDSFSSMSTPFPAEPVGAGARWEVKSPVKSQGMTIDQTATYQLVTLKDETATITSVIAQSAANQKISNPAMPNMKMDLTSMKGSGTGDISFDLTRLMPISGKVTFQSDTAMAMEMAGKKQEMKMKMDMNMSLESK